QTAIEPYGHVVLGGHFELGAAESGLAEAVQSLQQQRLAQAPAAPARQDTQVLDAPQSVALAYALHRAARPYRTHQQPGRLGQKSTLAAHPDHQATGTLPVAEAGEHLGIDLLLETAEQYLRVNLKQIVAPADEIEAMRQPGRRQIVQVRLHFVTLEIGDQRR